MTSGNPLEIYKITKQIGAGGAGTVYKAYHPNLQKEVIIKVLRTSIRDESRKRTEVDILKNLHHPYLPQVFDYIVYEGKSYTVMDYVPGESFGEKLAHGERFSEKQVIKYARQMCEALAYLHSRTPAIIHGDIKPDNVMLTPEDNVCLIDFNISGVYQGDKAYTYGYTKDYGAPEQAACFKQMLLERQKKAAPVMSKETGRMPETVNTGTAGSDATELDTEFDPDKTELDTESDPDKTEIAAEREETGCGDGIVTAGTEKSIEKSVGIPIDKRTDVYSLGATIYHIYSGKKFSNASGNQLKSKTSDGFLYILNKALQQNPNARYADAGQMLNALNNLYKADHRYTGMRIRHGVVYMLVVAMGIVGAILWLEGSRTLKIELAEQYRRYIVDLEESETAGDAERFEHIYVEAVDFEPDKIEAYYQKAKFLYAQKRYEDAISYIENTVLNRASLYEQEGIAGIYYLLGNSYFACEEYADADNALATAIMYENNNPNYYLDRAIAQARSGRISEAESTLETARKNNASDSGIDLAEGEIKYAAKNYKEAEIALESSIGSAEDEYTRMRAYIVLSKVVMDAEEETATGETAADQAIEILEKAKSELSNDHLPMILERITDICVQSYEGSGDEKYAQYALQTLEEIISRGWATYTTYDNKVNLYYATGNYTGAMDVLNKMEDMYPDNYQVYMKEAFSEASIQSQKPQAERDYKAFEGYYAKAEELYQKVEGNGWSDSQMLVLEGAYQDLIDGHWIN